MASNILPLFFMFVLFLRLDGSGLSEFQLDRNIELLAEATKRIIQQYYSEHASALSIIRFAAHPRADHKQSEIVNRVLLSTKSAMGFVVEEPKYMKFLPFLRFHGILFLDGYKAFRYLIKYIS